MARTTLGNILHWPLDNYPNVIPIGECAFNGINHSNDPAYECDKLWMQDEREALARAINTATAMIERQLGFRVSRQYEITEEQQWNCPVILDWGYVVGMGVEAEEDVAIDASDFTGDPYTITITLPTGATEDEIHVYETATGYELHPSSRTTVAGVTTLSIPKCRMAIWARILVATKTDPIEYGDATAFLAIGNVHVKRVYRDATQGVCLIWPSEELDCSVSEGCAITSTTGCMRVSQSKLGIVTLSPATWDTVNLQWTKSTTYCTTPQRMQLSYLAGLLETDTQLEDAIVRLAHSLMPLTPCGCDSIRYYWERDREQPGVLTREVINSPFGVTVGAQFAYAATQERRIGHGGLLVGSAKRSRRGWSTHGCSC